MKFFLIGKKVFIILTKNLKVFKCEFYCDSPKEKGKKKCFLLVKKKPHPVFEFSHSPEHTFTSGANYGSKAKIFSDMPQSIKLFGF